MLAVGPKFVFSVCRLVSRRCHIISAIRQFVPGSSQKRTWSVAPSGSQFESSPMDGRRNPSTPGARFLGTPVAYVLAPRAPARRPSEARLNELPRTESSRCRAVYRSHAISNRHPFAPPALFACQGGQTRRHSPTKTFGAQHLQGRLHPLPLHLACFRAYASTRPLPFTPQGSILGSRLAITQVGMSPTRLRGIAEPHCPRNSPPQVKHSRDRATRVPRPPSITDYGPTSSHPVLA